MSRYTVPHPKGLAVAKADAVAEAFERLDTTLDKYVPGGRELAIVKTHLQQAFLMAVAAVTE